MSIKHEAVSHAVVPLVVKALEAAHPGKDIVGINVVYVMVEHDGTEDHDNCKIVHRHAGGTKVQDPTLLMHVAKATQESADTLTERASVGALVAGALGAAGRRDTDGE
jgi:hypothetical protein